MLNHTLNVLAILTLVLNGCVSVTEKTFTDRSISDEDELFVLDMGKANVVKDKYVLAEYLPNMDTLAEGTSSRDAFKTLGKATAICIDMMGMPLSEAQVFFGSAPEDPVTQYSTCAFWKLATIQGSKVQLLEVTVRFEKTVTKSKRNTLGNPFSPMRDQGWKIRSITSAVSTIPLEPCSPRL
jgi:hypothetical protein